MVSKKRRAVVVGGSMVGMAAARACRDHFDEVWVVDKDLLPREGPEHRRGVPQSWHIHNLIIRGQRDLERLFPGYRERALALGATELDHGRDVARYTELGWMPLFDSGFVSISASRALLEHTQRMAFAEHCPDVVVLEGTRVTGVSFEEGPAWRATGVSTDHADARYARLEADLVIDCSGRAALWKRWFSEAGIPPVEETVVDSGSGYASCFLRHPDPACLPWRGMVVDAAFPDVPHWGVIVPIEHGLWVATLGGFNGEYPPGDREGFTRFARELRSPALAQALAQAEPTGEVRTFRRMEMRWNHFERQAAPVQGLLAVGDSAWAYNPLYGQGMTVGIGSAALLLDELERDASLHSLARRYYARAAAFAGPPWRATALRDLRWPRTEGEAPWHAALTMPLSELLLRAAHRDTRLFERVLAVAHLVAPPSTLLTPRALVSVTRYLWQRLVGQSLGAHDPLSLPPPPR